MGCGQNSSASSSCREEVRWQAAAAAAAVRAARRLASHAGQQQLIAPPPPLCRPAGSPHAEQVKSPMTLTEKILANHSDNAAVVPGQNIWTRVDKLMTHDVCGPGTFGIFQKEFGENAQVCGRRHSTALPVCVRVMCSVHALSAADRLRPSLAHLSSLSHTSSFCLLPRASLRLPAPSPPPSPGVGQ